jgi:hypothetical protein
MSGLGASKASSRYGSVECEDTVAEMFLNAMLPVHRQHGRLIIGKCCLVPRASVCTGL